MKLFEPITEESILDEITRITGVTSAVYKNKQRIARVNFALDKYWALASDTAPKGTFDDVNHASIPVETQSLVAGTNAYKISTFTNEVLQILKISALDEDAKEMDLYREEFEHLDDFQELYSTDTGDRGTPQFWAKMGDYIYIRPCPDYAETNGLRAYVNRELSKFVWTSFTTTFASDLFNATAHGLTTNDVVIFETDNSDLPSGLTEDTTVYYVIASGLTADVFKVSTTLGGSTITLADNGTGNYKFTKVNKEPGIPVIHHDYLARYSALPFIRDKKLTNLGALLKQIGSANPRDPYYGGDELAIVNYWAGRGKELRTIIETKKRVYK